MEEVTFPRAVLTVDVVVLLDCGSERYVLLIERGKEPFKGKLALPGGHFDVLEDESVYDAAMREVKEETGLRLYGMVLLDVFDKKDRDPRGRYVSVAFATLLYAREGHAPALLQGDDAAKAMWVPVGSVETESLAFDHRDIFAKALKWSWRFDSRRYES